MCVREREREFFEPKWLSEKAIHNITDSDSPSNHRNSYKNLEATLLFVDFIEAFDSIHRGNMYQILLAYGLHKEAVTAINETL